MFLLDRSTRARAWKGSGLFRILGEFCVKLAIVPEPTPFEKFRALVRRTVAVPKSEIEAREVKYRNGRKNKHRRRHR